MNDTGRPVPIVVFRASIGQEPMKSAVILQCSLVALLGTATGCMTEQDQGREPATGEERAPAAPRDTAATGAPGDTADTTVVDTARSGSAETAFDALARSGLARSAGSAPPQIRGIYLNAYAAGSRNRLAQLLALADRTEINTFVIDVKTEAGIHYTSDSELARSLAQPGHVTIGNLAALADTLHAHDLHAIARIVVFKDPILSKANPAWSIRKPDGSLWRDKKGNTWISPWNTDVWDYNVDIAREVVEAGFDEIQFDYVRFPEAFPSLPEQVHPDAAGTKTEAIVRFLTRARSRLHPLGGIVAADVFGLSPNDPRDVNIGQQWEPILAVADHVLPMVYPSHYFPTHLKGVPRPNRMPYETVFTSLGIGVIRATRLADAGVQPARVIPWLQAFSAPWVDRNFDYGPEQAEAQIRGVYDVGLDDWIFWHPGSKYEQVAAAFEPSLSSRAVAFDPTDALLAAADLIERAGIVDVRRKLAETLRAGEIR